MEFVGYQRKDFHDSEWSFPFGSKFGARERVFKVTSLKPYFGAFLEWLEVLPGSAFMVCLARSWAVRASFLMVEREFGQSWMAGIEISEMMVGRAWGLYPIIRKNGDWLVME